MNKKKAEELSKVLLTISEYYDAKANGQPYSEIKFSLAKQSLDDFSTYIDKRLSDVQRDFLFTFLGALDIAEWEEEEKDEQLRDYTKLSRYAFAFHRVAFVLCGEEKWDDDFKKKYFYPLSQMYDAELFEEIMEMSLPHTNSPEMKKKSSYRFNEENILSLPAYFGFRMLLPLLILPFILGVIIYIHSSDYTEAHYGDRYEITVTDCEYENTDEYDYLYISCKEFEEKFEVTRFFQYSNSPEELIGRCEAGERLVVYAEYKKPKKSDNYYEVIQLEGLDGKVYRSYEHTNQIDKYVLTFLVIAALILFVPFFVLFLMMLIVATNREKFVSHPRFVKFCFPNYSLKLEENPENQ